MAQRANIAALSPSVQCRKYRHSTLQLVFWLLSFLAVSPAWAVDVDVLISNFTDSPDPVIRGSNIVYSAVISNSAENTANGVELKLTLDATTQFVSVDDHRCSHAAGVVTCAIGSLGTQPVSVNVTARTMATTNTTVSATAAVTTTDTDANTYNNVLSQVSTVNTGADLGLTLTPYVKSASNNTYSLINAPVLTGSTIKYVAGTSNLGPDAAGKTTVTIGLSIHLTYVSAAGSGAGNGWTCAYAAASREVTCTRDTAAVGALPNIELVAQITGAITGTLTSSGKVRIAGEATDDNPENNDRSSSFEVSNGADLTIGKTASPTSAQSAQTVVFTLTPRNKGTATAANVTVTDVLPPGFVYQGAAGSDWNCSNSGQTVTCTTANYVVGAAKNITITTTAPTVAAATTYTNTATITSDTPDPVNANTASATVTVAPDGVTMTIGKTRQLGAVAQGQEIRSTLRARYNGPQSAASGTVSIVDTLPAGEAYVSHSGTNWTCVQDASNGQRITCTYYTSLASGALTSDLVITSRATATGALINSACAFYNATQKACISATTTSTPPNTSNDLQVGIAADKTVVDWNDNTLDYTITVTNHGPQAATGVVMKDSFRGYLSGTNPTLVTVSKTGGTTAATFNCVPDGGASSGLSTAGNYIYDWPMTCTQVANGVAMNVGETAIFTVAVKRPLAGSSVSLSPAGKWRNTATVYSTQQGDTVPSNNSAYVDVQVNDAADLQVVNTVTPGSVEAGVNATYVVTVTNRGLATATGVTLTDVFTPSAGAFTFVAATPSKGTCAAFNVGSSTLSCTLPDLKRNETTTVTVVVRPDYMGSPPNPRTLESVATVAAASNNDSDPTNNGAAANLLVMPAAVDLLVNVTDTPDPLGYDSGVSPAFPANVVTYRNIITNRGPSLASGLAMVYTMAPPAGVTVTFLGDKLAATGQSYSNYCDQLNQTATSLVPLTITCHWPAGSTLANDAAQSLYLDFKVNTLPLSGVTLNTTTAVSSNETDSVPGNNSLAQTTTIKSLADVGITKQATDAGGGGLPMVNGLPTVAVNTGFLWKLQVTNHGPGDSTITTVTDTLPAGVSLDGGVPPPGCGINGSVITCALGTMANGANATINIPVKLTSGGVRKNCAEVTTSAVDTNGANNSACSTVQSTPSTLAGTVYSDDNGNNVKDGLENTGISGVTVTLSGTETDSGQTVSLSTTSDASGNYSFTGLNAGTYTVTSGRQTNVSAEAGSLGGTIGGVARTAGTGVANQYQTSLIALPASTNAVNYNFGVPNPGQSISGYVYLDLNWNRKKDPGEPGIPGAKVNLYGRNNLTPLATTTTDGSGAYAFSGLQTTASAGYADYLIWDMYEYLEKTFGPSAVGYTQATSLPEWDYYPYSSQVGTGIATAGNENVFHVLEGINLKANEHGTDYNFGYVGTFIHGVVYHDANNNGILDFGEGGIANASVTLSGNTANGTPVCNAGVLQPGGRSCTITTDGNGHFWFFNLPTSDGNGYTLTESLPNGYINGKNIAGTCTRFINNVTPSYTFPCTNVSVEEGTASGSSVIGGVKLPRPGYTFPHTFLPNSAWNGFGEILKGGTLTGLVYVDRNDSRSFDSGEQLAAVVLALNGKDSNGQNVSKTTTTGADGTYLFDNLPASDAAGYTITETQPAGYGDYSVATGTEVGAIGGIQVGTAARNVIAGIVFPAGGAGLNYNFRERLSTISGYVYRDGNGDGSRQQSDSGIQGVTVTLTRQDAAMAPVAVVTDANGAFVFSGLFSGTYTLEETQPIGINDGRETAGTVGGSVDNSGFSSAPAHNRISAIILPAGSDATDYLFGETPVNSISGRVYHDRSNAKKYDAGSGISGVTLTLTGLANGGIPVEKTTQTAPDGSYAFNDLPASDLSGGYTISETQPAGLGDFTVDGAFPGTIGAAVVGSSNGANIIQGVRLPVGQNGVDYDFRERASSLRGYVYHDNNDNGVMDTDETGISGITVTLTGYAWGANNTDDSGTVDDVAVSLKVSTDLNGAFYFSGLMKGTYEITETQPAGYGDGKETAGSSGGTVTNSKFDDKEENNRISGIPLPQATDGVDYLFGERGGVLRGFVYHDANDNGVKDVGEAGIPNIDVTLTGKIGDGTDVGTVRGCGVTPANCRGRTDDVGAFAFDGMLPGTYQLVENQAQVAQIPDAAGNSKYADGKEAAGAAGGVVDNSDFGILAAYNTISEITLTTESFAANNAEVGGYLFGERTHPGFETGLKQPVISGYVFNDVVGARQRKLNPQVKDSPLVTNWEVRLIAVKSGGGQVEICKVTTGYDRDGVAGYYRISNLDCGSQWRNGLPVTGSAAGGGETYDSFTVTFSKNGYQAPFKTKSENGYGDDRTAPGAVVNVTVTSATEATEINLPLDPSGRVYDAITRAPVAGAIVQILKNGVLLDNTCLVGGPNTVTTPADGYYSFFITTSLAGCRGTDTYSLQVTPPAGYAPGPSAIIPPQAGALTPPLTGGNTYAVQVQDAPPQGAQPTTYYLTLNLTITDNLVTSSDGVIRNHIPIDPINPGQITVTKTTPLVNVARGDLVPYTLSAKNNTSTTLPNINFLDQIPPGFKYRTGSAKLGSAAAEPAVSGRQLSWSNLTFAPNETKVWSMLLTVGAGVSEGQYTNQAWAAHRLTGAAVSNLASATVRVVPDPTFDCSDIIGKVFDDQNANGYQDDGEPGIPNVRLATARGLLVTTDAEGRFHVACAAIPQAERGSNFVMKLDERTLPTGYRLTTENPRDVRVTRGKLVKLNFGAAIHRVARLDMTDDAFEGDSEQLKPEWQAQLQKLPAQLKQRPSVLRVAYKAGAAGEKRAEARIRAVIARVRMLLNEIGCCDAQVFEEEVIRPPPVMPLEGAR